MTGPVVRPFVSGVASLSVYLPSALCHQMQGVSPDGASLLCVVSGTHHDVKSAIGPPEEGPRGELSFSTQLLQSLKLILNSLASVPVAQR